MSWPKGKPRGPRAVVPVGERFHRLTVVGREALANGRVKWICRCDCGVTVSPHACDVKRGHTKSCGCANQESRIASNTKHGYNRTPTYVAWSNMWARCTNPKRRDYKNYGGRGIVVCQRWERFEHFLADMGEKPGSLSLDRINNDEGYSPNNCRWATASEQRKNQRPMHIVRAASAIEKAAP